jgi:hypothetical protein
MRDLGSKGSAGRGDGRTTMACSKNAAPVNISPASAFTMLVIRQELSKD